MLNVECVLARFQGELISTLLMEGVHSTSQVVLYTCLSVAGAIQDRFPPIPNTYRFLRMLYHNSIPLEVLCVCFCLVTSGLLLEGLGLFLRGHEYV